MWAIFGAFYIITGWLMLEQFEDAEVYEQGCASLRTVVRRLLAMRVKEEKLAVARVRRHCSYVASLAMKGYKRFEQARIRKRSAAERAKRDREVMREIQNREQREERVMFAWLQVKGYSLPPIVRGPQDWWLIDVPLRAKARSVLYNLHKEYDHTMAELLATYGQ